jgi:DNA-binding NarL/FixJ family response regulator
MEHSVVLVDDHILIAKALGTIINEFKNFRVLYEVAGGRELMEKLKTVKNVPDIVLLDISMPVMDGFAVAAWLKAYYPGIMVMALTMEDDDEAVLKMIKAGACGYLLKNIFPAELEKALNQLVSTGHYYPVWATNKLISRLPEGREAKSITSEPEFTDRENEFLEYCCTEMSYKEIGEKMKCSPRTVEMFRDSIAEKLNIRTRVGLAMYAIKIGKGKFD